ncbi:MAG: F0F1 ATP synthase subunit B [Alphaproteobacteria bacterium]|nr:F0F1 ATP synthase subunit B [Alphaproteobacteria bacterium]
MFGDPEFWVLIAALIFIGVAWRPGRKALLGSLDARAARIRDELDEARRLREDAERLLGDYQRREREAAAEAAAIVAHARAEAERVVERSARELEQALQRRQLLAQERIAQAEARALSEIRSLAADVAIAAARQVIVAELDESRAAQLLDAAIAELPRQLH